jgi:hypothetical protein
MTPESTRGRVLDTLEPLLDAVRDGVEHAAWSLSGLQKTTSHEFEGRWAGECTRSAYLFFHRDDLPEVVSVEVFLDETSRGLRGNLSLVLEAPSLRELDDPRTVLSRVAVAAGETLPDGYRVPVSIRIGIPDSTVDVDAADVQLRVKLKIPAVALDAGASAVSALASSAVSSFERLLERPEVAELLPPVIE